MSKKFSLPKKKSATEATATPVGAGFAGTVAFPASTTNFREDFKAQAAQLKEKIVVGPTPKRIEKPKNDLTLDKDGKLKGELELVEDGKKSDAISVDLSEQAKAVNESVKRPVFKRKAASVEDVEERKADVPAKEGRFAQMRVLGSKDGYNYSGCGGRSWVRIDSDKIDTWPTREAAIDDGHKTFKETFQYGKDWDVVDIDEEKKSATEATRSNDTRENDVCIYNDYVECTRDDNDCSSCPRNPSCPIHEKPKPGTDRYEKTQVIKDERESEDKEPKEAVAVEGTDDVVDAVNRIKAKATEYAAKVNTEYAGFSLTMEMQLSEMTAWKDEKFQAVAHELMKDQHYFVTPYAIDGIKDYYVSTKDDFDTFLEVTADETEMPAEELPKEEPAEKQDYDDKFYDELSDMEVSLSEGYSVPESIPAGDLLSYLVSEFGRESHKDMYLQVFKEDKKYYVRKISSSNNEDYYISVRDDIQTYLDASENEGEKITVGAREEVDIVKDERESEDKEPKEAVACESRFPTFNAREKAFIAAKDASAVRAAMANGTLSKARGRHILYSIGEKSADEEIVIPKATDKGVPVEQPEEAMESTSAATAARRLCSEAFEGYIDTEIGDNLGCDVVYTSKEPVSGQVNKLTKEKARQVAEALESFGIGTRTLSAGEEYSVLFTEAQQIPTAKWYALVKDKQDAQKVLQLTLTTSANATQQEVQTYLQNIYGSAGVLQVSATKIV